ncbi:unnamed protein product [Discosporangium mesarthrocarpum]
MPLPYHRNAFTAAQAAQVVRSNADSDEEVSLFAERVFNNQELVLNDVTATLVQAEVEAIFQSWAVLAAAGLTPQEFQTGMASSATDFKARYQFKYACLHQVYGTPSVFVGGVASPELSTSSATPDAWRSVLSTIALGTPEEGGVWTASH